MPDSPLHHADPWALEAARLPLAFAQVREDPRLDVEIVRSLPENATIVMIASGGETLVELARLPVQRIHAVDMNEAQLALARLKCHLATHQTPDDTCRLLGHEPLPPVERGNAMRRVLDEMSWPEDVFGPPDLVSELGVDHAGRYERCFAEIRRVFKTDDEWMTGNKIKEALEKVMSLPNLTALFGHEATQNPARPFHEHFAQRTRIAMSRTDASVNPFLWQMYRGRFAPGYRYDWMQNSAPLRAEVIWHHGRMADVLNGMAEECADLVHLSNILDWLSPDDARMTLAAARRVLRPGGRMIIRQLNSSLCITALADDWLWNTPLAADMERRDRSFFYPQIHLGTRT